MAEFLLDPPPLAFKPAMATYRAFTAGMLPEKLRAQYGLPEGLGQQVTFQVAVSALRATFANTPPRLRYFPAYVEARRRLKGKGRDHFGRFIEDLVVKNLPQAS